MTIDKALEITGNLSKPSKMPCFGFSISRKYCFTGAKMSKIPNSICSKCYCKRGNYPRPNVVKSLKKRFKGMNHPLWTEAMTTVIGEKEKSGYFRFFDSGGITSIEDLDKICAIARNLPKIRFWLPTNEYAMVAEYRRTHEWPENLTVRLSSLMIDGPAPAGFAKRFGCVTSGVSKEVYSCPAPKQGGKCLTCRNCWDKRVKNVVYKYH